MIYKREKYLKKIRPFYHDDDLIKVISGVRRCGKSTLMQTIATELEESGVEKENIIYLNLDAREHRLIRNAEQLEALILSKIHNQKLSYLFVDEIQNVTGFEEVINGFRTDGNLSIFITGSNSYLLSGELVTKLTGRYIEFELFTLTFEEYEEMKKLFNKQIHPNANVELNQYIVEGGFPRTVLIDGLEAKRTYVSSVINEIFEKDIKRRVKIKDTAIFDSVLSFVINNFGATSSIQSITNALVKHGIRTTRATVSKYITALLDAKILYQCNRFDMKSKKSLSGEKKYYLADLSFYFMRNTDNRINYGPVLENIVYLYARSFGYSISIGKIGTLECDFILRNPTNNYAYVQVAYTILQSEETEDREYRPLEKIRDNYPKYVVTTDYSLQQRGGIHHVNLMDFITQQSQF